MHTHLPASPKLLILTLLASLVACNLPAATSHPAPATTRPAVPTLSPIISSPAVQPSPSRPSPMPAEPTSIPTPLLPPAQYSLQVIFDYHQHTLAVAQTIAYTNATGEALTELPLIVEANRWPGAFTLKGLAWADGANIDGYTLEGNRLLIPLSAPLPPGGNLELSIVYTLALPAIPPPSDTARPVPFGYTERQSNLVEW